VFSVVLQLAALPVLSRVERNTRDVTG